MWLIAFWGKFGRQLDNAFVHRPGNQTKCNIEEEKQLHEYNIRIGWAICFKVIIANKRKD
jgi:hypothetical protein